MFSLSMSDHGSHPHPPAGHPAEEWRPAQKQPAGFSLFRSSVAVRLLLAAAFGVIAFAAVAWVERATLPLPPAAAGESAP